MKQKQRSVASRSSRARSSSAKKTKRTSNTGSRARSKSGSRRRKKSAKSTMRGGMVLAKDFREFIASLNEREVRYLIIGGIAVAAHGHPRYTKDMDVWVWLDKANAVKLVSALNDFGFASLKKKPEEFLDPNAVHQFGVEPNRIDVLTDAGGVPFEECYERRVVVKVRGVNVNFISREDLFRTKQSTGRLQDLADIEQLGTKISLPKR